MEVVLLEVALPVDVTLFVDVEDADRDGVIEPVDDCEADEVRESEGLSDALREVETEYVAERDAEKLGVNERVAVDVSDRLWDAEIEGELDPLVDTVSVGDQETVPDDESLSVADAERLMVLESLDVMDFDSLIDDEFESELVLDGVAVEVADPENDDDGDALSVSVGVDDAD